MNKIYSKQIFIKNKIKTPKFISVRRSDFSKNAKLLKNIYKKIKFPIVSKPINEGSSLGVKISENKIKLFKSIKNLLKKYDELILEEYIGGQEVQVAVINGKALGAIELILKDFFMIIKLNILKRRRPNM